jgi:hypothetical protein
MAPDFASALLGLAPFTSGTAAFPRAIPKLSIRKKSLETGLLVGWNGSSILYRCLGIARWYGRSEIIQYAPVSPLLLCLPDFAYHQNVHWRAAIFRSAIHSFTRSIHQEHSLEPFTRSIH